MKPIKNSQIYQLVLTQFLETIREPAVLFWGIGFPILISLGLGLAFTQKLEFKFNIAVVETHASVLDSLLDTHAVERMHKGKHTFTWSLKDATLGNTELNFFHTQWDDAIIALKRSEADLIISDSAGVIVYHFDPHNSQAQLVYMKLTSLLQNPETSTDNQETVQPLTLIGVRYIDFLIPGLIALGIINQLFWGVSYTIVERRSQKLLRRMVASPMRKSNFLIALILVRAAMNFIETSLLLFFAWLCFGTVIQGSIAGLLLIYIAGNVAFAGISVLIASRTAKTEVGNGIMNAISMPMMVLSGIFFSYHNFPEWSIGFIKLLPLTAFADGMRAIFNEGAGFVDILLPSAILCAFGALCFTIGVKVFKWY